MRIRTQTLFASIGLLTGAAVATADDDSPTPSGQLPPATSDNDPAPPVPSPPLPTPEGGLVRQAGVGGDVGYGRAGVLELGGSAGFSLASDFRRINVSPTIGWFVVDNLELSGILSVENIKSNDDSSTLWSALVEPSYHIPFNRSVFGFAGLGVGAAHVSDIGTGFAVAPRIGANLMVGRSGVLTPSLAYQYTTIGSDVMNGSTDEVTIVAVASALRFNVGYTAMW